MQDKTNIANAWELFKKMFGVGMDVVIITDEDRLDWGKIVELTDDWVEIQKLMSKPKRYAWEQVTLMCHDGFPVRKLGPRSSDLLIPKLLERPEIKDLQTAIRAAMTHDICGTCEEIYEEDEFNPSSYRRKECDKCYSLRAGHPWEVENVICEIFNVGNDSPQFWNNHIHEETIVMRAKNGLGGQLWGLHSVFEFA